MSGTAEVPHHLVVMGVSGTGKTTVGSALAYRLGRTFIEGDCYHPERNVAKMSAGEPLDDDDRRPWLQTLNKLMAAHEAEDEPTVVTCSALKRSYRDLLREDLPPGSVYFVHLAAPREVLQARMEHRTHFMPPSLLQSQLDTLEPLDADEVGRCFDVTPPADVVCDAVEEALHDDA
jgi:gluconokinase